MKAASAVCMYTIQDGIIRQFEEGPLYEESYKNRYGYKIPVSSPDSNNLVSW